MEMKEFGINEQMAKYAKMQNSFSDYKENSATNHYRYWLDKFKTRVEELIENSHNEITSEMKESIQYYADRYSKKVAEYINNQNRIDAMMPSIMISGGGNFNVRKKQKQNSYRESNWLKYKDLFEDDNYYIKKIDNMLNNKVIYSNDEFAIEKIENKIEDLEQEQQLMKDVNAYYRKNKTLDGCDLLSEKQIEELKINMARFSFYDIPFASYNLTNNNANIKRLKERVTELKALKERAGQKDEEKYIKVDGLSVEEDATDMRIRILFDNIPSAETRDLLKKHGFKWSPKNSAWQRQLTSNGIFATKQILFTLRDRGV